MRDGAVNYLAKPIDLDELLATVRQAIGITESAPLQFDEEKHCRTMSSPAARSCRRFSATLR